MPVESYEGETYVAYLDISGFKELMKNQNKAKRALGKFYSTVYDVGSRFCSRNTPGFLEVNAVLFSDCAVLFSKNSKQPTADDTNPIADNIAGLKSILSFIQQVNQALILSRQEPIMTVCSIDYGEFKYEGRIEFTGIDKGFVIGKPFVNAFLDVEQGKPKIQPTECRLLIDNLRLNSNLLREPYPLSLLKSKDGHYYFYWMLPSLENARQFEEEFQDTYNLKYAGMIQVVQKYVDSTNRMGNTS